MSMWPQNIPLRGFYGPPPFAASSHFGSEAMRAARVRQMQMNAMRPHGPPGILPMRPPPGGLGYPPPPPGHGRPPMVDIISVRSEDEYDISEKEDEQLMFVNFVEELEKTNSVTVADLLRIFTTLKDVTDEDSLGNFLNADSDYDSDGSTSTSSSSEIIND